MFDLKARELLPIESVDVRMTKTLDLCDTVTATARAVSDGEHVRNEYEIRFPTIA